MKIKIKTISNEIQTEEIEDFLFKMKIIAELITIEKINLEIKKLVTAIFENEKSTKHTFIKGLTLFEFIKNNKERLVSTFDKVKFSVQDDFLIFELSDDFEIYTKNITKYDLIKDEISEDYKYEKNLLKYDKKAIYSAIKSAIDDCCDEDLISEITKRGFKDLRSFLKLTNLELI